jgi:hypothetical protein
MAKLVVTRPRESVEGLRRPYQILVNGRPAASIGAGGSVDVPLPPGRHQVRARMGFIGSQPVEIETGAEGVYHLKVGSNPAGWRRWGLGFILPIMAPFAILVLDIAGSGLFRDPIEGGWFGLFMIPMMFLPVLVQFAFMVSWRDHFLALEEFPTPDPAARRVVLPKAQPIRVRITIRGMMIAVAVLAIVLGATVEWARFTRHDFFQRKAGLHMQLAAQFRGFEQDWVRMAVEREKGGADAASVRQSAARCAARADYHAAMKRKYEQAAARRRLSVEPDPPEPPWP